MFACSSFLVLGDPRRSLNDVDQRFHGPGDLTSLERDAINGRTRDIELILEAGYSSSGELGKLAKLRETLSECQSRYDAPLTKGVTKKQRGVDDPSPRLCLCCAVSNLCVKFRPYVGLPSTLVPALP